MIIKLLLQILCVYLIVVAAIYIFQRHFLYFPERFYTSLEDAKANKSIREIEFTTEDNLKLKAWYAERTAKPYVIVFFHGNGDSLRGVAPIAAPFIEQGYGFLLVEYRGYSGLPGLPTETGLYADGRAAIKTLLGQGIHENEIILMGHSLGTGIATQMATEFKAAGLVLMAPYMAMGKMAQLRFPFIPADLLLRDRFDSASKITKINMPLLIMHGEADMVVPSSHGKNLFDIANQPKEIKVWEPAGHVDLFEYGAAETIMGWAAKLSAPQ